MESKEKGVSHWNWLGLDAGELKTGGRRVVQQAEKVLERLESSETPQELCEFLQLMSDLLINDDLNHYLFTKPVLADPQKGFLAKLLQKAVFNERFLTEKMVMVLEGFLTILLSNHNVHKAHLKAFYSFLATDTLDRALDRNTFLDRLLRILKIFYVYLENRNVKPNIYYLFPKKESHLRVTFTKAVSKLRPEEGFCLSFWFYVTASQSQEPQNIIGIHNQASEGLTVRHNQGFVDLLLQKKPLGDEDEAEYTQVLRFNAVTSGVWNYATLIYEYRTCNRATNQGQNNKQFICVRLNEKEKISLSTDLLADFGKSALTYSITLGQNYLGQIASVILTRRLNQQLNTVYKEYHTFKLLDTKSIIVQNDFLAAQKSKDIIHMLCGVNATTRDGLLLNKELVTGNDLEFFGDCTIINKTQILENIDCFGGFEALLMILTKIKTSHHLKVFFEIFYRMMKLERQNLAAVREKCILKALAGFLEASTDLLDERIQTIFFDMTESINDRLLMRQILKYFYMNINLISKTPVGFQKFAADTVCTLYKERELRVEELIPLDWIVKYITIYSILETADEPKETGQPSNDTLSLKIGETSGTTYHYIVDIIKSIVRNLDLNNPNISNGIVILLRCICYPNLSPSIQSEYLNILRIILEDRIMDGRTQFKCLDSIIPCLLILFKNTLYARIRSYIINLLNLVTRKMPMGIDMNFICFTLNDILESRGGDELGECDQKRIFEEWNSLLNNLTRFMLGYEPDFSNGNRNILGESSKVKYPELLNIIYDIYHKVNKDNKQKVIQDLIMLFGFDFENAVTTFRKSYFFEWLLDVIFNIEMKFLDQPIDQTNKGVMDLATKLVASFMANMIVKTSEDHKIFYRFLAICEKKAMKQQERIKDLKDLGALQDANLEGVALLEAMVSKIHQTRAKLLTAVLDTLQKMEDQVRFEQPLNFHNLHLRVVNYLFSYIPIVDIDARNSIEPEEEGAIGTPGSKRKEVKFNFQSRATEAPSPKISGKEVSPQLSAYRMVENEGLLDRCYSFERSKDFARYDEKREKWHDEPVFLATCRSFEYYMRYPNIEEFISDLMKDKVRVSSELLYRNKLDKFGKRIASNILVALLFGIDFYTEKRNVQKMKEVLAYLERLFYNVFALNEYERRNLTKKKIKCLDVILIFIMFFLSSRKKAMVEKKDESLAEMIELLVKCKDRLWRSLLLSLKCKIESMIHGKESSSLFKLITFRSPAKVPTFVDDFFFNKYALFLEKKSDFIKNIDKYYVAENFFQNFDQIVEKNENLKILIETGLINKETNRSELTFRGETINELKKSVGDELSRFNTRKKLAQKCRGELEEKIKEMQADMEENLMTSTINAEMIQRECRYTAHTILQKERDVNGMWADPNLRNHIQWNNPFKKEDYDWEVLQTNPYYKYELNPWFSHKYSRPFLGLRLKKYWKDNFLEKDTDEKENAEMNIFDRGSNKTRKNKKKYVPTKLRRNVKLFAQRILSTAGTAYKMLGQEPGKDDEEGSQDEFRVIYSRSCELLSRFTIYNGLIMVTKKRLIFCTDNIRSKNYLSILNVDLEKHDKVKEVWNLNEIIEIQRRRVVQRKTGLEIFFLGGYSLFLNLAPDEADVQELHDLLMSLRESFAFYSPFSKIRSTRNVKLLEANRYTERWMAGELSNFHYLMILNNYSGRSYHDLSQYHVFPWITIMYKTKGEEHCAEAENLCDRDLTEEEIFSEEINPIFDLRNLSKPMGALGSASRLKSFLERFQSPDHFSNAPAYHYGSHYSSPAIILHYLIRLEPFSEGAKAIQNGHFDLPDRLFFSINHTFRNATEETSDVRELTPEFYSLPEFLLNLNREDFGVTQTGERINNVWLPRWAQGNPYYFVYLQSKILESQISTFSLKNWIDLIFGSKQTGEEAEKSFNLFYHLTYEDQLNLDEVAEKDLQGIETQVVHFGQTPSKLFSKPHPSPSSLSQFKVRSVNLPHDNIQIYRKKNSQAQLESNNSAVECNSYFDYLSCSIYLIASSNSKKIAIVSGTSIQFYTWELTVKSPGERPEEEDDPGLPFSFNRIKGKEIPHDFYAEQGVLRERDPFVQSLSHPTCFLEENKTLILGGYYGGALRVYNLERKVFKEYQQHKETVTVIKADRQENFCVTGSQEGQCIVWTVKEGDLTKKFSLTDFESAILDIFLLEESYLMAVGSAEGKVLVVNMYTREVMRTLHHPQGFSVNKLCLSLQPFGSLLFYSEMDGSLYSYSVNGQMLKHKKVKGKKVICMQVGIDSKNQDFVVMGTTNGEVGIGSLPFLQDIKFYVIFKKTPIISLAVMKHGESVICGDVFGNLHIIFNDTNLSPKENKA